MGGRRGGRYPQYGPPPAPVAVGRPAAAGLLAVAALPAVTSREVADPAAARALGVGSGGALLGVVFAIWTRLGTQMRNAAEFSAGNGGGYAYEVGVGGHRVLVAARGAAARATRARWVPAARAAVAAPGAAQPPHRLSPPPPPPHRF